MKHFPNLLPAEMHRILKTPKLLDQLIAHDEKSTLIGLVSRFGTNGVLSDFLCEILNDTRKLDFVIQKSYKHQNGFHKIVLSKGDQHKLRLHVFKNIKGIEVPMENIHNHRWNFASLIYRGSLKMQIFQPTDKSSNLYFDHDYVPATSENKSYTVKLLGVSSLKIVEQREFKAGQCYYMEKEELHRVVNNPNDEAVTVMMTGVASNPNCKLYSNSLFTDEQKQLLPYSRNELVSILEKIIHP